MRVFNRWSKHSFVAWVLYRRVPCFRMSFFSFRFLSVVCRLHCQKFSWLIIALMALFFRWKPFVAATPFQSVLPSAPWQSFPRFSSEPPGFISAPETVSVPPGFICVLPVPEVFKLSILLALQGCPCRALFSCLIGSTVWTDACNYLYL